MGFNSGFKGLSSAEKAALSDNSPLNHVAGGQKRSRLKYKNSLWLIAVKTEGRVCSQWSLCGILVGEVVLLYPRERVPVHIVQQATWTLGPVWTGAEIFCLH